MRNFYPGFRGDSRFIWGAPFLGGLLGGLVGGALIGPRPFIQPYPVYPPFPPYPVYPYGGFPYYR